MIRGKLGRLIGYLSSITVVLGCLMSLFSFISPFYHFDPVSGIPEARYSNYFWSFKVDNYGYFTGAQSPVYPSQLWFSNYWFAQSEVWEFYGVPWILVSMFATQIATLALGIVSAIAKRRLLSLMPVLLCLTVISFMSYFNLTMQEWWGFKEFGAGYWFTFPSLSLFLLAFIMRCIAGKTRTAGGKDD